MNRPWSSSCPIREHTADGRSVGRCWHYLETGKGKCPRHGDVRLAVDHYVRLAVDHYVRTGELTDDARVQQLRNKQS